ncbi:hypothetical protein TeGR_g12183 [Tetraparma gracilis]|uniref:Uncharacterized protein n=1 Tax=Tetraparma gracilis TaxID=2962635 RepID=A0ABQ6MU01_9STRA|nr:hypothetical protein TeGR_g12183 [Tetraparma gracilis]
MPIEEWILKTTNLVHVSQNGGDMWMFMRRKASDLGAKANYNAGFTLLLPDQTKNKYSTKTKFKGNHAQSKKRYIKELLDWLNDSVDKRFGEPIVAVSKAKGKKMTSVKEPSAERINRYKEEFQRQGLAI